MTKLSATSSLLATRYVNALLSAAEKQGGMTALLSDMATLDQILAGSPDFMRVLSSPVVSISQAGGIAQEVMEAASLGSVIKGFVASVIKNRRGAYLVDFLAAARREMSRRRGVVAATAYVACPMTLDQTARLKAELEGVSGAQVDMQVDVVPDLLGGIKVRIGSVQIDDSVAGKLDRLKQILESAKKAA